ncbi:MAG: CHAT domain-containing protein [Aureispira sp.]
MPERPVLLLTFANQQDAYLEHLKEESDKLNYILSTLHDKEAIEIYKQDRATTENVIDMLDRFNERIALFHYGGHADGNSLRLEGGDGNATGLAEMLGRLKNLKLVFLNGCATQPQVEELLAQGVKTVIATAVKIDDEKAVVFAENFYRSLSNGHNIRSSFKRAVSNLKFVYGGDFDATIVHRGETAVQGNTALMPWGLYVNEGADEILQWELPLENASTLANLKDVDSEKLIDFKVNKYIEEVIFGMFEIKPELEALVQTEDEDEELDARKVLLQIIQNFPWPIGTQIRLLVANDGDMNTPSMMRLKQLVSVYIVTSQFLFYIIMSQIWDEKRANTFNAKSYLIDMLHINKKQFGSFDYFRNFIEAIKLLKQANQQPNISEFADIAEDFDAHEELYNSYLYMESLRAAIHNGDTAVLEAKTKEKCVQGEDHLSTILYNLAFLIRYDLVTVRDIHVVNYRNLDTEFNHFISRLNVNVGDIAVSEGGTRIKSRVYKTFTNNASVILTENLQDPSTFLNLSPFIIDKNAFSDGLTEDRATQQQLYIYAHREDGDDPNRDYQYYATFHNVYIAQERTSDQFAINASTGEENNTEEKNVRSRRRSSRRRRRTTIAAEVINPYAVLKKQFEILEQDLIGH